MVILNIFILSHPIELGAPFQNCYPIHMLLVCTIKLDIFIFSMFFNWLHIPGFKQFLLIITHDESWSTRKFLSYPLCLQNKHEKILSMVNINTFLGIFYDLQWPSDPRRARFLKVPWTTHTPNLFLPFTC